MPTCANATAGYARRPGPKDEKGRPLPRLTSRARDDAAPVGRLHPPRRHRVQLGQAPVEPLRVRLGLDALAHVGKLSGQLQVVDDGTEVQAGATHEQRPVPPLLDRRHRRAGVALEARHVVVVARVDQVDQVVRHLGPLADRRLGRADVHASVHLHRVDADDLPAPVRAGELVRDRRLPARRRTDDGRVQGHRYPARTGMRVRWLGCETIARNSPRKKCGAALVTSTVA